MQHEYLISKVARGWDNGRTRVGGDRLACLQPQHAAQPVAPPLVVAEAGSAFMSWNVATNVTHSEIYEGMTASQLKLTKTIFNVDLRPKLRFRILRSLCKLALCAVLVMLLLANPT